MKALKYQRYQNYQNYQNIRNAFNTTIYKIIWVPNEGVVAWKYPFWSIEIHSQHLICPLSNREEPLKFRTIHAAIKKSSDRWTENYYESVKNYSDRVCLTRLRIIAHRLEIELGRRNKTPERERTFHHSNKGKFIRHTDIDPSHLINIDHINLICAISDL